MGTGDDVDTGHCHVFVFEDVQLDEAEWPGLLSKATSGGWLVVMPAQSRDALTQLSGTEIADPG